MDVLQTQKFLAMSSQIFAQHDAEDGVQRQRPGAKFKVGDQVEFACSGEPREVTAVQWRDADSQWVGTWMYRLAGNDDYWYYEAVLEKWE